MTERLGPYRLHPAGDRPGQVVGGVLPRTERHQALAELAAVEAVAAVLDDGPERSGRARPTYHIPGPQPASDVGVALHAGHLSGPLGQQGRSREPVVGDPYGLGQHVGQRQPPVTGVQGQPAVHCAGHWNRGHVAVQRHLVAALRPQPVRVSPGPGETGGVERDRRAAAPVVHERPHVTAGPAHVGRCHRQHRIGPHRSVRGRSAPPQQVHPHAGGQVIDGRDHPRHGSTGHGGRKSRHATQCCPRLASSRHRATADPNMSAGWANGVVKAGRISA